MQRALSATLLASAAVHALDCATFDINKVKLITFDVFAALMDTKSSLTAAVAREVGTDLPAAQHSLFADCLISEYASFADNVFDPAIHTPSPFVYVIRRGTESCLSSNSLLAKYPSGSFVFEALAAAWGNLTAWPNTVETLKLLSKRFHIAPLSNADEGTLRAATKVFEDAGVKMFDLYGSDFPVGAFKPRAAIYEPVTRPFGIDGVIHVAGGATDATGARTAGLWAALVRGTPNLGGATPCWTFSEISQLPGAIGYDTTVEATPTSTASSTPSATASVSGTAGSLGSGSSASSQPAAAAPASDAGLIVGVLFAGAVLGAGAFAAVVRQRLNRSAVVRQWASAGPQPAVSHAAANQLNPVSASAHGSAYTSTAVGASSSNGSRATRVTIMSSTG